MAYVPTGANPLQTTTTQDLMQLAYLLYGAQASQNALGTANQVAGDAYANLRQRVNATESAADQYMRLLQAIAPALTQSVDADSTDLTNRTNQIFSAMVPTIDRANALTASQGYAKAMKNGMGDSTQAMDNAATLSRNFGDVYQKLMETSRQRAFDELKASLAAKQATGTMASNALANLNGQALKAAQETAAAAAARATTAQNSVGSNLEKLISGKAMNFITDNVQKSLDKAGGFTGLLTALKDGLGGSSPAVSAGNPAATTAADDSPYGTGQTYSDSGGVNLWQSAYDDYTNQQNATVPEDSTYYSPDEANPGGNNDSYWYFW